MKCNSVFVLLAVGALIGGCSVEPEPQQVGPDAPVASADMPAAEVPGSPLPSVAIDLSTPDKALKSYWAVRDSVERKEHELRQEQADRLAEARATLGEVTATPRYVVSASDTDFDVYARDIVEVDVQSESRAVIIATIRNVTPVPAGAQLDEYDVTVRRDGERYKYVLEKFAAGWKVAEIWAWRDYGDKGWQKWFPEDSAPVVRTLTMGGM